MAINNQLKISSIFFYTIFFLLSCLLLSSFITPASLMDEFQNGPKLWFYFVMSLLLAGSGIYLLRQRNNVFYFKLNIADALITIILFVIILKKTTINEPFLNNKILSYICISILFFIVKLFLSTLNGEKFEFVSASLVITILVVIFIACCFGLLQLYNITASNNPEFKVTGNFYNPARYADYLTALLPFCLSGYLFYPTESKFYKLIRYSSATVGLISLLILPATYARSAWIGIAVPCSSLPQTKTTSRFCARR